MLKQLQRVSGKNFQANNLTSDQISLLKKAGGILTSSSASGYVPNFAAAALQQAIAREKSAGLSDSQIYVDQNSSLKSSMNPMGLMVANRRDEPAGGFQGIARARKEGMNPKLYGAANGFVPNYVSGTGIAQSYGLQQAQPSSDKINKSFADTAGKIFLLQSALSFLQGAVGDTENSFAKVTNTLVSAGGNITSLALLGKEIQGIKIDGTGLAAGFGKFAKGLGIAGVAFGVVTEGFKFANFAIKEFSGENAKAALATAKLADASDKLSIKFDSLSKTRQTEISTQAEQILGSAGYEGFFNGIANFFREQKIGGGDIGSDPAVKQGVAQLLALGASKQEVQGVLESGRKFKEEKVYTAGFSAGNQSQTSYIRTTDVTQKSDITAGIESSMTSGLGKELSDKFLKFSSEIENIDFNADSAKVQEAIKKIQTAIYGTGEISPELAKTIEGETKKQEQDFKIKAAKQAIEFNKPINVLKRSLEKIISDGGLVVENVARELERQSKLISAISSSKSFASLSDSSKLVFEIDSSSRQLAKELENRVAKFGNDTQADLLKFVPELGLSKKVGTSLTKSFKNLGQVKTEEDVKTNLNSFNEAVKKAGQTVDKTKFAELTRKITEVNNSFGNLQKEIEVEKAVLALNNSEKLLEARAYDTYKSKLAGFVEEIIKGQTSLIQMRGDLDRIDIKKQGDIEIATANARSSREAMLLRQDIESKAFQKKQPTEQKILLQEKELAAKREFFTKDNIAGLNRNTEALNNLTRLLASDFINKIDESIKFVQDMRASSGPSPFGGGPVPLTTGITLPSGIKDSQDAVNYLQNLKGVYSSSANLPMASSGGNLQTANSYLERIGNSVTKGLTFAQIQDEIGKFGVTPEMQDRFTEYAQQLLLAYKESSEVFNDKLNTLKAQQETEKDIFDLQNSYAIKLKAQIRALNDSLTDPQTAGEYASKLRQRARDATEVGKGSDAERRAYRSSFGYGLDQGLEELEKRTLDYKQELGVEIPRLFSSNLAQGLNDAISGAKDLKTALTDAATSFFQEISRKNISNLADMVTGGTGNFIQSLFKPSIPKALPVNELASGGFIKGGSGTKDDVPAMLMGGEYVMKKSAVNKYGKGFLDALNNGKMRGYATGGLVDPETFPTQTGRSGFFTPGDYGQGAITGKNELLTFATQSFTGGQYDYMGGFGMSGASVGLEPESARLSSFGRENSPMFERVQQSKDEAFGVYLQGLQKEKEYSQLLDQIAKDKKARKKQLQMAIISAVASTALNFAGSAMLSGAKNGIAAGAKTAAASGKTFGFGAKFMAGAKGMFTGAGGQGGLANIFKGTGTQLSDLAIARQNAMSGNIASQSVQGAMSSPQMGNQPGLTLPMTATDSMNLEDNIKLFKKYNFSSLVKSLSNQSSGPKAQGGGFNNPLLPQMTPEIMKQMGLRDFGSDGNYNPYIKRASGGLISGGSGTKDDIPAMLTGGEFVLNNRATQRLGVQNLNKLNNGQSVGSEGSSAEMTQALISKLDELIQTTSNSSQSNVVVNVSSTDQQEENPADMNERDRELQKKIRQAVLDVIAQEKRLGGSLEKSR